MQISNKKGEFLILSNSSYSITKEINNFTDIASFFSNRSTSLSIQNIPHNRKLLGFSGLQNSFTEYPYLLNSWTVRDGAVEVLKKANIIVLGYDEDTINIALVSGLNSFLDKIKNATLADLDVLELDHENTINNIRQSVLGNRPYYYLFGNNNGRMLERLNNAENYTLSAISPSVKISYLLNKLFSYAVWSYEVEEENEYLKDYLLYPLGIEENEQDEEATGVYKSTGIDTEITANTQNVNILGQTNFIDSNYISLPPLILYSIIGANNSEFIANISGKYTVKVSGTFGISQTGNSHAMGGVQIEIGSQSHVRYFQGANVPTNLQFTADALSGDDIKVNIWTGDYRGLYPPLVSYKNVSIEIGILEDVSVVEFSKAFLNVSLSDFLKEFLMRYSLIPIIDEYENKIKFITQKSRIEKSKVFVLNTRHVKKVSYNYQADLAQENYFKHKYNEDLQDYADGVLSVRNENLKKNNTTYQSFTYAPDGVSSVLFREGNNSSLINVNNTPTFEVEAKDKNGEIKLNYKPLENRFYIAKATRPTLSSSIYVNSNLIQNVSFVKLENTYKEIVNKYEPFNLLFNSFKEVTILADKLAVLNIIDAMRVYIDNVGLIVVTRISVSENVGEIKGLIYK